MIVQQIGSDPSRFPVPVRIVRHRENDAKVLLLIELRELVEKRRRGTVAIRIDKRHTIRKVLLGDVPQHAPEDGDADPAGDEDIWTIGVLGKEEVSLRLFHVDLGAAVARIATIAGFTIAASVLASIIDALVSAITGASTSQFGSSVPDDVTTGALLGSALLTTVISVVIGGAVSAGACA